MSHKANVVKLEPRTQLAAGLHLGRLERRISDEPDGYRVALPSGEMVNARLAPDFEGAFADECLRERRGVMLNASDDAVTIVGALQTHRSVSRDQRDNLHIEGKRVRVDAEEGIAFHVGKSMLRFDKSGAIKLCGQRMSIDVTTVVRFLSALVELP